MLHLFLKTKKFIPNEFHDTVYEVDFETLYKEGKRLILSDLDNTLISYDEYVPTKENLEFLDRLKKIGFEVILLSNNVPSRINKYCKDLDIIGYANARKPLNIGMRKAYKNASKKYKKDEIIVMGDQLMTDIWGANRFATYSILVNPIKKKTEKWYTKINRRTEIKMIEKIKTKCNDDYRRLQLDQRR